MNLQPITMERSQAHIAYLEYRNAVKERHSREDELIMRGYREIARGRNVLGLRATIAAGGEDEQDRPRLALARADRRWCHVERHGHGGVTFWASDDQDGRGLYWSTPRESSTTIMLGALLPAHVVRDGRGVALVPSIPPALRPAAALSNYHILFEAEWRRVPPKDPALLRHLGGDLYAVVATWDLTELERAVLAGRLTA